MEARLPALLAELPCNALKLALMSSFLPLSYSKIGFTTWRKVDILLATESLFFIDSNPKKALLHVVCPAVIMLFYYPSTFSSHFSKLPILVAVFLRYGIV
jgi:hypothetical protein